jgi:hypothetical protein
MGTIRERKSGKGKAVYHACVRRSGFPKTYRAFSRLTDAKAWIQDMESNIRSGRYLPQAEAQRHKLSEAIDRYIEEELPKKPKAFHDQKRELLWYSAEIGSRLLSEISPAVLNVLESLFVSP